MCTPVKDDMQMYTIILYSSIGHNNNARNTGQKTWPRFNHNSHKHDTTKIAHNNLDTKMVFIIFAEKM